MKRKRKTDSNIPDTSFLKPWLDGKYSLPQLVDLAACSPNLEDGWWVSINKKIPFHEVLTNPPPLFDVVREQVHTYYQKAITIALDYDGCTLEHEDRYDIAEQLGLPPGAAHPIYLVTIEKDGKKNLVYVGQSKSKASRFASGHHIAIKLLNPEYDDYMKSLYYAQVMLFNNDLGHVPLELISDEKLVRKILDDTERRMIYRLQPTLNEQGKMKLKADESYGAILIDDPHFIAGWLIADLV